MKFLIVLAIFLAAVIAEETKVAEVTDQQVEAARYGGYGGYGYRYGRSVAADTEGQESHYGGYYGRGYGHRYGRSVAADTDGQESYYGGYYGRRYGRSVADDTQGQESHYGGYPLVMAATITA